VKFFWFPENLAHVGRHGLKPEQVEAVFRAGNFSAIEELPGRWVGDGEVDGRTFRVVFGRPGPGEVFVATAYRISPRRKKT